VALAMETLTHCRSALVPELLATAQIPKVVPAISTVAPSTNAAFRSGRATGLGCWE
jgi:hypothetical protein